MNDCNATLTLLSRTDEVVARAVNWRGPNNEKAFLVMDIPDGQTVTRDGDRLVHDDVTVVTCGELVGHRGVHFSKSPKAMWSDDTEGATPHRDTGEVLMTAPDGTKYRVRPDHLNELVKVSEEAGLYDDVGMSETNRHGDPESYGSYNEYLRSVGKKPCPDCDDGTRWEDDDGVLVHDGFPCPSCDGRGKQTGRWHHEHKPCPDCDGEGRVDVGGAFSRGWTNQCPSCGGSGRAPTEGHHYDCPDCDGSGFKGKQGKANDPRRVCGSCGGSGTLQPVPPCPVCGGVDSVEVECGWKGQRQWRCPCGNEHWSVSVTHPSCDVTPNDVTSTAVTDADLAAAARAWCEAEGCAGDEHLAMCWGDGDLRLLRAALEAAGPCPTGEPR